MTIRFPLNYVANANAHTSRAPVAAAGGGVLGHRANGNVLGVDSLPNWSSYFYEPGFDSNGFTQFTWPYTMVGRSPFDRDDRRPIATITAPGRRRSARRSSR